MSRETIRQIKCCAIFNYLVERTKRELIEVPYGIKAEDYYNKYGFNYNYIKIDDRYSYLYTKKNNKPICYLLDVENEPYDKNKGHDYYNYLRRAGKRPGEPNIIADLSSDPMTLSLLPKEDGKFLNKQAGILKSNPEYKNTKIDYFEYDLNSAYAAAIYNKIPDTNFYRLYSEVQENEIGFVLGTSLVLVHSGYADVIFPLIDTPDNLKRFLDRWYKRKRDKDPKYFAKHCLVQCIGYLQYHNPWLRAYIVETCNQNMSKLIEAYPKNWILVNTDAIYLTRPIDLDVGVNIGQYKPETGWIRVFNQADYETQDVLKHRGVMRNIVYYRNGENYEWLREAKLTHI